MLNMTQNGLEINWSEKHHVQYELLTHAKVYISRPLYKTKKCLCLAIKNCLAWTIFKLLCKI